MRLPRSARALALLSGLLGTATLGGCGYDFGLFDPTLRARGTLVDKDALAELVPGTSSRADAVSLIGTPTAKATFDDNRWIYISQTTSTRIGRTPGIRAQHVVILTFDQGGTLRNVQQLDRSDSKDVAMASGATPSPGSEASFMQQLLGNVGKFTPAGLPGGGAGGLGGGSSSTGPGSTGNNVP